MKILNSFQNNPIPRTEAFTLDEYYKRSLALIEADEGNEPNYYSLPSDRYGKSGATVGRGVDLGQYNRKELEDIGISESILSKVDPLLGIKNKDGIGAVDAAIAKAIPLTLEERDFLNERIYRKNIDRLIKDLGPSMENISPELFAHLASARYRGDLSTRHKTFELIKQGLYKDAADEFLNHEQYKSLKALDPNDGVVRRMDRIADAMRRHGYRRGGAVRDAYGRRYI
jgi:hypothetical protein